MKFIRRFVIPTVFVFAGCHGDPSANHQIEESIAATCRNTWPCQINLRDSMQFKWDELYVFKYNASKADIENAIHSRVPSYKELTTYLVFKSAGKLVLVESELTNVEHPVKNELVFQMPDTALFRVFPATEQFVVTQEQSEAGPYYLLSAK